MLIKSSISHFFGRQMLNYFEKLSIQLLLSTKPSFEYYTEPLKLTCLKIHYTCTNIIRIKSYNRFHKQPILQIAIERSNGTKENFQLNKIPSIIVNTADRHNIYSISVGFAEISFLIISVTSCCLFKILAEYIHIHTLVRYFMIICLPMFLQHMHTFSLQPTY